MKPKPPPPSEPEMVRPSDGTDLTNEEIVQEVLSTGDEEPFPSTSPPSENPDGKTPSSRSSAIVVPEIKVPSPTPPAIVVPEIKVPSPTPPVIVVPEIKAPVLQKPVALGGLDVKAPPTASSSPNGNEP